MHLEVRIDGKVKMADQILDLPGFYYDGTELTIRVTLAKEPKKPSVPTLNYSDIKRRLAAERASEGRAGDPQKPRHGGRRRGEPACGPAGDPATDAVIISEEVETHDESE